MYHKASYVGETYAHIPTRTHEHLETDKNSNNYQHLLNNPYCKSICDENCFSILDLAKLKTPTIYFPLEYCIEE